MATLLRFKAFSCGEPAPGFSFCKKQIFRFVLGVRALCTSHLLACRRADGPGLGLRATTCSCCSNCCSLAAHTPSHACHSSLSAARTLGWRCLLRGCSASANIPLFRCGAARLLPTVRETTGCARDVLGMCGMRGCCGCWGCGDVAGDVLGMSEMCGISGQPPPLTAAPKNAGPATAHGTSQQRTKLRAGVFRSLS